MADEGVIGVIPLGPLGIHPDPGLGNEAGQLGQRRDQKLLGKVRVLYANPSVGQRSRIVTKLSHTGRDLQIERSIEVDRVLRVGKHGLVVADP